MATQAVYRILPTEGGYCVEHDGQKSGSYSTREAAFEAAVFPASNAIQNGEDVTIEVPRSRVTAN
jgi:hypothetical protein